MSSPIRARADPDDALVAFVGPGGAFRSTVVPSRSPAVLGEHRVPAPRFPQIALEQRDQAHQGNGDDGRGTPTRRQECDLAEHVARDEPGDALVTTQHIGAPLLDREEGVAEVALCCEHGACVDLELAARPATTATPESSSSAKSEMFRMRSGLTATE